MAELNKKSKLENLKKIDSFNDFAVLLGYSASSLSYILYKIADDSKYTSFEIAKKNGDVRSIMSPTPRLSSLQTKLAKILEDCIEEIRKENPAFLIAAYGFRPKRTIVSNAERHKKRRYVLNLDLKDFFDSINFGRVRGFFIKDKNFALNPNIATYIAQIACHENKLPTGSSCSPVISNLITNILDSRLLRFSKKGKCTYTRYADDLSFSTRFKEFLQPFVEKIDEKWIVGEELQNLIERSGFKVNPEKTRCSFLPERQTVTGLTVNDKVNISADYYRNMRAICHSLFSTGEWYYKAVDSEEIEKRRSLNEIEGRLSHIYFVKNQQIKKKTKEEKKDFSDSSFGKLYKNFLYYKDFINNTKPLIVTEGETDITYGSR